MCLPDGTHVLCPLSTSHVGYCNLHGCEIIYEGSRLSEVLLILYSGLHVRQIRNVIRYHESFVGRDYKAWAQMALSRARIEGVVNSQVCNENNGIYTAVVHVHLSCTIISIFMQILKIAYSDYFKPKADDWN